MIEDDRIAVNHRKPGEVFELLSNDLRVNIVRALGEAREPLSFSASRMDRGRSHYLLYLGGRGRYRTLHDDILRTGVW